MKKNSRLDPGARCKAVPSLAPSSWLWPLALAALQLGIACSSSQGGPGGGAEARPPDAAADVGPPGMPDVVGPLTRPDAGAPADGNLSPADGIGTGETGAASDDAAPAGDDAMAAGDGARPASDAPAPGDAAAPLDATPPYPPPVDSLPAQIGACPGFAEPVSTGVVQYTKLDELSGLVESRRRPGLLWAHNDAGNKPRLFAMTRAGALVAVLDLQVSGAIDLEDIAVGPGPIAGQPYLYVGDIGDNDEKRPSLAVYRVQEPTLLPSPTAVAGVLDGIETLTLVYPDGTHNAETLLVDPLSGDLFVVTKSSAGESHVFRAPGPLSAGAPIRLQETGTILRFGTAPLTGEPRATGGDISPGGDLIALRSYDHAFVWRRMAGQSVAQALAGTPCPLPLHDEMHGEALGFAADGSGYYTSSEGNAQPIYWYASKTPR